MTRALLNLTKIAAQAAARRVAGPCPHCAEHDRLTALRLQRNLDRARCDAMRRQADEQEAEHLQAVMLVGEVEAYLTGVGEGR